MNLKIFKTDKFVYIVIAILVLAIYANSLPNDFVSDDRTGILQNPQVGEWSYVFRGFIGWGNAVTRLIIYHIFGLEAWAYRLYNIIFHIGSVWAVFYLFRNLYNKNLALFVAGLFAVHPILTESITWIAGASYVVYGFLFLVSFILFLESEDKYDWRYILSLILYLLAILNSEKAVSMAGAFILYKYIYSEECKASLLKTWSYLGVSAIFIGLLLVTLRKRQEILATEYYQEGGFTNPFYQIPIAVVQYIKLFVWPEALTLYHSETYFTYAEYFVHLAVFLLFVIPVSIFLFKIRGGLKNVLLFWKNGEGSDKNYSRILDYKYIVFWFIFIMVGLAPTLTPLKVSWLVAERYAYISTLGSMALVGFAFYKISGKFEDFKIAIIGIFICILLALGVRTVYRNMDWRNEDTLWFSTVKYSPSSPNIYNNLGDVYSRRGDFQKAIENFKYATVLKPNYADAYHNLAYTYQVVAQNATSQEERAKNYTLAEQYYMEAIKNNPRLWQSMQNLSLVYFENGATEEGYKYYQAAMQINPYDAGLFINYLTLNVQLKNFDEAEKAASHLITLQPTNMEFQNALTEIRRLKAESAKTDISETTE